MKKISVLSFIFFIFSLNAFSEDLISLSVGVQSGLVFYGDEEIKNYNNEIDGTHILIGALASVNVNPFEQVSFFASADFLCDFRDQNDFHSNHLHLDFPFGIKIYPGLGGLGISIAYTFGFRSDFINTPTSSFNSNSCFGNGAKIIIDYNFAHNGKSKFLPTFGCSWKFLPRGNNSYDNIISAFVVMNF